MQKKFSPGTSKDGESNIYISFIIRDRTVKHKFHLFSCKKKFLPGASQDGGRKIYIFFIIKERTFTPSRVVGQ